MGTMVNTQAWKRLRQQAFARDGHECVRCGSHEQLEADHMIARIDGGRDELENIRTLCRSCHRRRTSIQAHQRAHRRKRRGRAPVAPPGGFTSEARPAKLRKSNNSPRFDGVREWFPLGGG
ncbi:MAG: HNH endonuclease [Acidimicrobiales bacterium]